MSSEAQARAPESVDQIAAADARLAFPLHLDEAQAPVARAHERFSALDLDVTGRPPPGTIRLDARVALENAAYPNIHHGRAFLVTEVSVLILLFVGNYFGGAMVWPKSPAADVARRSANGG